MGNQDSKRSSVNQEESVVKKCFFDISNRKSLISQDVLKNKWSSKVDPYLYELLESFLFRETNGTGLELFKNLFKLCQGNTDDKVDGLFELLADKRSDCVAQQALLKFILSVINSVIKIEEELTPKPFKSWVHRSQTQTNDSAEIYAAYFTGQLESSKPNEYTRKDIQSLLSYFDVFVTSILSYLFNIDDADIWFKNLFPKWQYYPIESGRHLENFSLLNVVRVMFINNELPVDFQLEWRLLFSTVIDGESFSRFSGQITNKGPTIIIVQDKGGNVFGGFAPDNWTFSPNFVGNSSSFLFTLYPTMKMFPATCFNDHYQYLNMGQQTMPNGLGFGGQLEYFGLWLDSEFGKGYTSESCSTFRKFEMMSSEKHFAISHLEVWGVGQPPPSAAELGERSILDTNLETKAILEMAGKQTYSDGLRDEPDD